MAKETSPRVELGLSIFLIVLSVVIFRGTLSLPPGSFDPVGSAGFPRLISLVIGILSLAILIRAARRILGDMKKSVAPATEDDAASPTFRRRPDLALAFYALSLVYVSALALKLISFGICTVLFLFTSIGMLTRFTFKRLPIALLIALVIGFGCQYIFTQVFVLDLP